MLDPIITHTAPFVTVDDIRLHLRVDDTFEDWLVQSYIDAAVAYLQGYGGVLGRPLGAQTVEQWLDGLCEINALPYGRVGLVMAVHYYTGGVLTEYTGAKRLLSQYGIDYLAIEDDLPSTDSRPDAVRVTYETIPSGEDVKQIIRMLVAHYFDNRSAVDDARLTEVPLGVKDLIFKAKSRHI